MIYEKYLELKKNDSECLYLFRVGKFYIFINEDAEKISKITTLKIVKHAKDVVKCGFPENSLEKYLSIFSNLNLNVSVVDNINDDVILEKLNKELEKIRNINIDNITPLECFKIICELKKVI